MIDVVFQLLIFFVVTLKQEDILAKLMASRPAPDPNAKPEPEIIKETDQKRLTQVKIMRVAMGVLIVLSIALLAWIIWRSVDLLM